MNEMIKISFNSALYRIFMDKLKQINKKTYRQINLLIETFNNFRIILFFYHLVICRCFFSLNL